MLGLIEETDLLFMVRTEFEWFRCDLFGHKKQIESFKIHLEMLKIKKNQYKMLEIYRIEDACNILLAKHYLQFDIMFAKLDLKSKSILFYFILFKVRIII